MNFRSIHNYVSIFFSVTTVLSDDGEFEVNGCANDRDWLFSLYPNEIEPYLRIFHYCNKPDVGEDSLFRYDNPIQVWEPIEYQAGTIVLDDLPPA
jgi:hypothetical protein